MIRFVRSLWKRFSQPRPHSEPAVVPWVEREFSALEKEILAKVRPFTMTSDERIFHLIRSVEYLVRNNIAGAVVECGVWKGGSIMAAALKLISLRRADRPLYLYDTFDGMTQPGEPDVQFDGISAGELLQKHRKTTEDHLWAFSPLDEVKRNVESTGYPPDLACYCVGPVEETIPARLPVQIALLRLDTDWYSSTRHELEHLYPLLAPGGVLIIDDYGWWQGARKAVDDYFMKAVPSPLLTRIDETARVAIRP